MIERSASGSRGSSENASSTSIVTPSLTLPGEPPRPDRSLEIRERGEPELELWDRDILLGELAGDPESVLSGSMDGQLMSMLGAAEVRSVTMQELEVFSRRWMAWAPDRLAGLGVMEVALVCEKLRGVDRLDLASHLALCLMRAVWASGAAVLPDDVSAPAARSLFEAYACALWERCGDELLEQCAA